LRVTGASSPPSGWAGRTGAAVARHAGAAACLGLAFWAWYSFLRQVAGPLNPDEIYFAHHFWLLEEGKRQYLDFQSIHLPTYFQLLKPLVAALSGRSADLSFLAAARAVSAAIILAYAGLACWLYRAAKPQTGRAGLAAMLALLLVFIVLARMVEVRTDTVGLLLVNAGWAAVLAMPSAARMRLAAVLAGLSILFTARAAGNALVVGLALLCLAGSSGNRAAVRSLLGVAGGFLLAGLALYLAAPEWVTLVIRSCFLEPTQQLVGWSLLRRFLWPERLPLTLLIALGFLAGVLLVRRGERDRGLLIAIACAGQLLTIALDPNPFEYVYGWAAVPAVLGIVWVNRPFASYFPFLTGVAAVILCVAYTVRTGKNPLPASPYRLTLDPLLTQAELDRTPTSELVAGLFNQKRQGNLVNQLRVRSEVCRRVAGRVVSTFDAHPVCLDDALFYWTGLRWPALMEGDLPSRGAMSHEEFATMFMQARPKLFVWAHRWEPPRALLPATRQMLACCYDVYDGFAIYREAR
jgi:hypothetical protein